MYYVQDAHSFWNWIYFVCLIVVGSFFMMNLFLVVIAAQFSETKKRETARMLVERKRYSSATTATTIEQENSCWEQLVRSCQGSLERACNRFKNFWKTSRQNHDKVNIACNRINLSYTSDLIRFQLTSSVVEILQ